MSTSAQRIPLADAINEAVVFRALFEEAVCFTCWEFAGSIRRNKPDVGDIDHVVIPITGPDPAQMFATAPLNLLRRRVEDLIARGVLEKHLDTAGRPRFGQKVMSLRYHGRKHDLFCATPANFGCILTIRTGSSDFSHQFVMRLRARGHRQADGLLYQVAPYKQGGMELLARPGGRQFEGDLVGAPVNCPDEQTYFRAAGLDVADYPPEKRETLQ